MALIAKLITLTLTTAFFFGQLGRIDIYQYSISYLDLILPLIFVFNLLHHYVNKNLKVKSPSFLIFIATSWIVYFYNLYSVPFYFLSLLYLVRLTILLSFFVYPLRFVDLQIFKLGIISNLIFGLIQYLFWPDFTAFSSLNWDPHLYRLVSTYFDPTFTALIYLIFIIILFCSNRKNYLLLLVSYISLSLTYSRATFLSLVIVGFVGGKYFQKFWFGIYVSILVLTTIFCLPRYPGEGTKLERDSSIRAKIANYQTGIALYSQHQLLGVGYNNLPFIRTDVNPKSHAISGFDSSLLTILITTGIVGFVPFIFGFYEVFITSSISRKLAFIAVLVHSLFANSLLYPWTLIFLALI